MGQKDSTQVHVQVYVVSEKIYSFLLLTPSLRSIACLPFVYSPQTDVHKYVFSSKVELPLTNVRRCLCLLFPRIHRWDFYFGVNHIYADNLVVTTMALNFATFSLHNFIHDIVLWCKLYGNIAFFPFTEIHQVVFTFE